MRRAPLILQIIPLSACLSAWITSVIHAQDGAQTSRHTSAATQRFVADGLNFAVVAALEDILPVGGAYIADKFSDTKNGQGFTWGLCYCRADWDFLVRFDCDLNRDAKKTFPGRRYYHYGKIRDVPVNPTRFGLE